MVDLGSLRWWSTVVVVGTDGSSEEQRRRAMDLARKSGDGARIRRATWRRVDGLSGPHGWALWAPQQGPCVFLFS